MPRVDDPWHRKLENAVLDHMNALEGRTIAMPYHAVLDKDDKECLMYCESIGAHVVRTRPDRITILPNGTVIKWDAKTCKWPTGKDFSIEALPFLLACAESILFEVHYLFCCVRHDGQSYGIWAGLESLQMVQRLLIPLPAHKDDWKEWERIFDNYFDVFGISNVTVATTSQGNKDPFVCLWVDDGTTATWQKTIDLFMEEQNSATP